MKPVKTVLSITDLCKIADNLKVQGMAPIEILLPVRYDLDHVFRNGYGSIWGVKYNTDVSLKKNTC